MDFSHDQKMYKGERRSTTDERRMIVTAAYELHKDE
jgi:hypothetical protein